MKHLFIPVILLICLFVYSCANQGTPTGGPKDTIPPSLLESYPADQSIYYTGNSFSFSFDEMITTEKLKQQLVITPLTEIKYKIKPKKNSFPIEFEESFEDSTTYTFNFADGVTDVTEKISVQNFSFAFSTGPIIDSISINGTVRDLYTNQKTEDVLIAIFDSTDTLNIFDGKPKYFAKTNEAGQYQIKNIKNGMYKIYAFLDDNNNLKCEPDKEPHGFLSGHVDLNQSKDSVHLQIQLIDSSPFKFIRSKTTGRYFDVLYNKFVDTYELKPLENSDLPIPNQNLIKENKTLRFYPDSTFRFDKDSLYLQVHAFDSLGNSSVDSLFVKFSESKRKPEKFSFSMTPKDNSSINRLVNFKIAFDKPIGLFSYDSIYIQYDTLIYQTVSDTLFTWNNNNTELSWPLDIDPSFFSNYKDSLIAKLDTLLSDTTNIDSIHITQRKYLSKLKTNLASIHIPRASFISVDQDSIESIFYTYRFKSLDDAGSISGKCITEHTSYVVQLVDKKFNPIASIVNPVNYKFNFVKPGDYTIRVLIDENNDGQWSPGNILLDQEPEGIWFWDQTTTIRNNFILENNDITF